MKANKENKRRKFPIGVQLPPEDMPFSYPEVLSVDFWTRVTEREKERIERENCDSDYIRI